MEIALQYVRLEKLPLFVNFPHKWRVTCIYGTTSYNLHNIVYDESIEKFMAL